jgi:hypothetical protein
MEIIIVFSLFCLFVTTFIIPLIIIIAYIQQKELSIFSRSITTLVLLLTYGPSSLIAALFIKDPNIRKVGKISLYVFILSSALLLAYFNIDAYFRRESSVGGVYAAIATEGVQVLLLKLLFGLFVLFGVS